MCNWKGCLHRRKTRDCYLHIDVVQQSLFTKFFAGLLTHFSRVVSKLPPAFSRPAPSFPGPGAQVHWPLHTTALPHRQASARQTKQRKWRPIARRNSTTDRSNRTCSFTVSRSKFQNATYFTMSAFYCFTLR